MAPLLLVSLLLAPGEASGRRPYPTLRHDGLTAEQTEQIYRHGVRHLTLDDRSLAESLARRPGLATLTRWTAAEVQRLRTVGALPTVPVRNSLLTELSARYLERLPASSSSLEAGVDRLAGHHPGVTLDSLTYLGRYSPRLARAILRHLAATPRPTRPPLELDAARARALPLSRVLLQKILARPGSPVVARLRASLQELDRQVGIGNGALAPDRHVDRSESSELRAVMAQVYRHTGRRTLAISAILEILPRAAVDASKPRDTRWGAAAPRRETEQLLVEVAREAVGVLSQDYQAKVIDGCMAPENFREAWAISPDDWAKLIRHLPDQFIAIDRVPLDDRRLDAVATGYRQLLAGTLNSKAFYLRTGVGSDLLALLQAADPRRFPRPEGAPVWQPIARGHDRQVMAGNLARLDAALTGQAEGKPAKAVIRAAGLSQTQFDRLLEKAPPSTPPSPAPPKNTIEQAGLLGDRASAILSRRILVEVADVVREVNADPELVARVGELSTVRYQQLRALAPERFPPLGHSAENEQAVSDLLAAKIGEIKRRGGSLAIKDLMAALQGDHPGLKPHRLQRLRRARPELFADEDRGGDRRGKAERRRDAARLARLIQRSDEPVGELADRLRATEPRFTRDYAYALRTEFAGESFFRALRPHVRDGARAGRPANEVARLLLELSPPGTSDADLMHKLNQWLERQGLPPYTTGSVGGVLKGLYASGSPVRARNARIVSEIVAEYAATAPPGTTEAAILAQVQRDYPTLKPIELGRYRSLWQSRPADYPALARFHAAAGQASGVELRGLGERRGARYRGGWDVERAVLGPARRDPELAGRLARLSQYPRIPARLPVLDKLVADLGGKTPLRRHNLLMVSHLLGTTVALTDALRAAGIATGRAIIVGTPYGTNEAVRDTLRDEGFDVRVPALSPRDYRETVERAVRDLAARYRRDPGKKPILVLDDGGLVTDILHSSAEFADVISAFRVVEQTTRGITMAQQRPLKVPVLDVPSTFSKKAEGRFIGEAVAAKVVQALRRQRTDLRGRRVVIMGNGVVGSAVARAVAAAEPTATICFVETNQRRAAKARHPVDDKESALGTADVIIGSTGEQSLSLADLRQLKDGAVIVSASSKRLEFDLEGLQAAATREPLGAANPLVKLPSARYRLGGKSIVALGDGWPINFDGDVEDIAPEHIQITRALMFAAALQVAGLDARLVKNQRLVKLDPAMDRKILKLTAPYRRRASSSARFDPDRWMDTVRDLAQL